MSDATAILIPDIGDFEEVEVIDVLVRPGDAVQPEDPLITLESDKASMDIPAPEAGIIQRVIVKVGDKVSQGSLVLNMLLYSQPSAASSPSAPQCSTSLSYLPPLAITTGEEIPLQIS